ncbi:MAG: tripartite tricarboxylate transporter substrate binding protein [Betaproteobacteria bacterium]|nr:MAG: tripartite tricarboxylate transporter substrate binding protein [Betaproteobacteria bacterium]
MLSVGCRLLCSGMVLSMVSATAHGQAEANYPVKPVRIVVGFTPGSATDVTARIFAQKFTEAFGTPFAVENIPGVAGAVGGARIAKAAPDGYSLYYGANGAMTIAPTLMGKLGFDPAADFAPIGLLLTMPSILAVNPYLPVKTVQELVVLARKRPGELSYASPGAGTPQHIAGELIKLTAKLDITHVPYKGAVMTDVIGGRVPMTLQNVAAIVPTIREGRLRALAVTSLKRSPNIADIPTLDESGFRGFEAISWFGLFAPAGTPPAITTRLYQESMKVLAQPDIRARLAQLSLDIAGTPGNEVTGIIRRDIEKWAKVIKQAGITVNQ